MSRGIDGLQAWVACLTVGFFFFYEFFQLNTFDVLNPFISHHFLLNAPELGLLSSVFIWANLLCLIPAGMVLDWFPIRTVVLTTLMVCILGVALLAETEQFWLFLAGRFLTGIGNAFCFLACVISVSRWFSPRKQGLVMGLMVTLAFVGGVMAHTPFSFLIQWISWRQALWLDVVLGLVGWMFIFMYLKEMPEQQAVKQRYSQKNRWNTLLSTIQSKQLYLAGLYTSLLNLPIMVLCALWGASYLKTAQGLSSFEASQVISWILLGSMLGCPLLGKLSDLQGRRKPVMWLGIVGMLLCFLPFWWIKSLSVFSLSVLLGGIGFFSSAQVISYPLLAESYSPHEIGEATGLASLIIMGGAALGQLLFGFLIQYHAQTGVGYSADNFQYAMGMFPLAILLAAIVLVWIRETDNQNTLTVRS